MNSQCLCQLPAWWGARQTRVGFGSLQQRPGFRKRWISEAMDFPSLSITSTWYPYTSGQCILHCSFVHRRLQLRFSCLGIRNQSRTWNCKIAFFCRREDQSTGERQIGTIQRHQTAVQRICLLEPKQSAKCPRLSKILASSLLMQQTTEIQDDGCRHICSLLPLIDFLSMILCI